MGKVNGTIYSAQAASLTGTLKRMPEMPPEQRTKILDMHNDSRANAGIYVAVVLAVYVILLTILLCRYARRQRFLEETSEEENPNGLLRFSIRKFRRLTAFVCCLPETAFPGGGQSSRRRLTSQIEISEACESKGILLGEAEAISAV